MFRCLLQKPEANALHFTQIFLLYTRLSSSGAQDGSNTFTGLGFVDSKHDQLLLTFDLPPPIRDLSDSEEKLSLSPSSSKRRRKRHHAHKAHPIEPISLEVKLAQDNTALRSKKGDTGKLFYSSMANQAG